MRCVISQQGIDTDIIVCQFLIKKAIFSTDGKIMQQRVGQGRPASADIQAHKVNVLERAVAILRSFSRERPELTLSEVAKLADLHTSTATRLLSSLMQQGLVLRDVSTGRYSLGLEIIALADVVRAGSGIVGAALSTMVELRDHFNETVVVGALSGDRRIDLEQVPGLQETRRIMKLGEYKPLYAGASGKAILSAFSDDDLDSYIDRTALVPLAPGTIIDPAVLRDDILLAREHGYAESQREFKNSEAVAYSAPLIGPRGKPVGSLTITMPRSRLNPELRLELCASLVRAAAQVSSNLGASKQG